MSNKEEERIAILAYGSLIWEPGVEISQHTIATIDIICPFKIEYARKSQSRENAPTLVKMSDNMGKTNAKLLIMDLHNSAENEQLIKDILKKRERCSPDKIAKLELPNYPSIFYANLDKNIAAVTPEELAELAIASVKKCKENYKSEKNGIRYLINNIKSGVVTELTVEYSNKILEETKTHSLEEAEAKLLREKH